MSRIDSVRIKDVDSSLSTKGGRTLEVRCGLKPQVLMEIIR